YLNGVKAYIVGGFIRDILMDIESPDRDLIVCGCSAEEFSKDIASKLNAHNIELDKVNKIYRVVLEDKINYIDITEPIENDFEKDIKRRDITINAIAYDIESSCFIDLAGGIEDIKNRKIRGITEKNFEDDPLRLLRIFRFYSKTGFEIDEELIQIAKKLIKSINIPAKERITTELLKLFEGEYCAQALIKLDETGLLEEIFPIYKDVKKIPPNSHHHLDLLHHLIETVNQIEIIYKNSEPEIKKYLEIKKYGNVKQSAFLKLAGFLHDIGKPYCWTIEEETHRHRFIQHDSIGAKLVVPILKELKFSKKQTEYIKNLIKYHIYPSSLVSAPDVSEKAFLKFYRKTDGYVIDVIILAMADRLSARGEQVTNEMVENNISNLTKLLNNYVEQKNQIKPVEKLLDGHQIMELLNIEQGPKLGKIIYELKEAQIAGDVNTKQEAIEFIKKSYRNTL
ncbi:MAG: HD domain-containing protein, partial [Candidatus Gastranaerophilales bacterium]|nr:HD domain-containing protein [Candidatus Gastranaerophilales bacterium]